MMGKLICFVLFLGLTLGFQNCGSDPQGMDLLAQSSSLSSGDCAPTESCPQEQGYLWMSIRDYDPYKIHIESVANSGHFNVSGQCGVAGVPAHDFLWVLQEGFGAQRIAGEGVSHDPCQLLRFSIPIFPNRLPVVEGQRYSLRVELVGLTSENKELRNPMAQGSLDVIFTSEPPK